MTTLPRATAARAALRDRLTVDAIERAQQRARAAHRSLPCVNGRHVGQQGGCTDGVGGCLCACHDPADTVRAAPIPAPATPVTFSDRSAR
ncbi:hypothetical protein [Streptomyces sp. NPDC059994]|uniref:hypothetical protein n=1 Tax=Streptomyces sp. NPDC059994 TaxID=3347029 RepID=UPI0036CB5DD5